MKPSVILQDGAIPKIRFCGGTEMVVAAFDEFSPNYVASLTMRCTTGVPRWTEAKIYPWQIMVERSASGATGVLHFRISGEHEFDGFKEFLDDACKLIPEPESEYVDLALVSVRVDSTVDKPYVKLSIAFNGSAGMVGIYAEEAAQIVERALVRRMEDEGELPFLQTATKEAGQLANEMWAKLMNS